MFEQFNKIGSKGEWKMQVSQTCSNEGWFSLATESESESWEVSQERFWRFENQKLES